MPSVNGATAFISDIHGNLPALKAVIADIERSQCRRAFFLGDVVNGVDPHGCVDLLHQWGQSGHIELQCIKGNAEAYLVTPDRTSLPRQDEHWNREVTALVDWFEDHLTEFDLEWIRSWPTTLRWQDFYLVHDSPMDRMEVERNADPLIRPEHREWFFHGKGISQDLDAVSLSKLMNFLQAESCSGVFSGHTHKAFCQKIEDKYVCNAGSAGAPLDGDPRSSWVLLSEDLKTISMKRVDYDLRTQLDQIDRTGDYPVFSTLEEKEKYKIWIREGLHWRDYQERHS